MSKKTVTVIGHEFDCTASYLTVKGVGHGSSLRVAAMRAIERMLWNPELRGKRIGSFKATFTVSNGEAVQS